MTTCRHHNLTLLPHPSSRLRCRHCHLTITPDELGGDDCPECLERYGVRRNDFEAISGGLAGVTRYRCEACGAFIESS